MKRIRELNNPTLGLDEYLNCMSDDADWDEFRSHNSGASYRELRDALTQNQHGLCAYCEIAINGWLRQVEHVIPQSNAKLGKAKALGIANMVACCFGGTVPDEEGDHYRRPVRHNMSCGQAKGNQSDEYFIDPRELPALPSLMRVLDNGLIEADENACQMAGFPPDRVTRTIELLNLNVERLRSAREKRWNGLEEELGQVDDPGDPDMVNNWIRSELTPDEDDRLVSLFTTTRSYFGTFSPLAERVLKQQPQAWI